MRLRSYTNSLFLLLCRFFYQQASTGCGTSTFSVCWFSMLLLLNTLLSLRQVMMRHLLNVFALLALFLLLWSQVSTISSSNPQNPDCGRNCMARWCYMLHNLSLLLRPMLVYSTETTDTLLFLFFGTHSFNLKLRDSTATYPLTVLISFSLSFTRLG